MVGVEPTRRGVWNPSGYLSLTRLFVEPTGYDPVPLVFQTNAMTTSATAPFGCLTDLETASPSSQEGILAFGRQTPFY